MWTHFGNSPKYSVTDITNSNSSSSAFSWDTVDSFVWLQWYCETSWKNVQSRGGVEHLRVRGQGHNFSFIRLPAFDFSLWSCRPLTSIFVRLQWACSLSASVRFYVLSVDPGSSCLHPATTIYLFFPVCGERSTATLRARLAHCVCTCTSESEGVSSEGTQF